MGFTLIRSLFDHHSPGPIPIIAGLPHLFGPRDSGHQRWHVCRPIQDLLGCRLMWKYVGSIVRIKHGLATPKKKQKSKIPVN